ncbi:MAG TPA: rhomboid family intramembrane serine protease [Polyangiaceae bacterium]|nr:rhomboid family intramembrane serine protease [Polyangiaceae bacterium]
MPATVACANCSALNDADFARCIRCNRPLKPGTPRPRLRIEPVHGTEPWLGRWDAESLPATKLVLALNGVLMAAYVALAFRGTNSIWKSLLGPGERDFDDMAIVEFWYGFYERLGFLLPSWVLERGEAWRILSACFAHFGVIHFAMNMFALIHLSRLAEPALGSVRYLIAYVGTGILGFAASLAWTVALGEPHVTAGASGAVFGLMGVVLGFLWRRRDKRWKAWLVQGVLMSVVFTFLLGQVNHAAHFAGLGSGVMFGALFAPGAPKPSLRWQRVLALLLAFACVASLAASPVVYFRKMQKDRSSEVD